MSSEEKEKKIKEIINDTDASPAACNHDNILEGKAVSHYEVMLSTFIDSRNELDKQMLTISVATLGVLIAIADRPEEIQGYIKVLVVASAVILLINIMILLRLLSLNSEYACQELNDNEENVATLNTKMIKLDFLGKILFSIGLLITTITLLLLLIFK